MRLVALLLAAAALALPASAAADSHDVAVQFQAFGPDALDILPGENVIWTNVSERNHTVTADDGSFDDELAPGNTFAQEFDNTGLFTYHCRIHAGMVGAVNVEPVILGPLPTAAVPAGDPVEFEGRTADAGQRVRIERATGGAFQTIATATPAADGTWKTSVPAESTGDYRAANDSGASSPQHLIVSNRRVLVRATRRGIVVTVQPALPYGHVVVQEDLRERFGWWAVKGGRLDYVSQASFSIARPARLRVILVGKDGWTALATSSVVALGHTRRTHAMPPMPMRH